MALCKVRRHLGSLAARGYSGGLSQRRHYDPNRAWGATQKVLSGKQKVAKARVYVLLCSPELPPDARSFKVKKTTVGESIV